MLVVVGCSLEEPAASGQPRVVASATADASIQAVR